MRVRILLTILAAVAGGFSPAQALAAPGEPDTTFADHGRLRVGLPGASDFAASMVQDFTGKLVIAGTAVNGLASDYDFMVRRYHPDGSPDSSFGDYGAVLTSFGWTNDRVAGVSIQADGQLVVGGDSNGRFAAARYNLDGSLDPTFDGDGRATIGLDGFLATGMALQADGKVLVGGVAFTVNGNDFAVARFNADGSPDPSFDGDGIAVTPILGTDQAYGIAVQADGKILLVGDAYDNLSFSGIALVRYNSDGSLDTGFDGDGKVVTPVNNGYATGRSISFQTSLTQATKIVVAGSNGDFVLARYNLNGSLDTSFDGDGIAVTPIAAGNDEAHAVRVQYSGATASRIVVAGYSRLTDATLDYDIVVARYLLNGSLDTSFDGDGVVRTALGPRGDFARALLLSGGRITVTGWTVTASGESDCATVRYNSDGSLDATFDSDGKRTDDTGRAEATGRGVAIQLDGKIVVAGSSPNSSNNLDIAVARFNSDGSPDTSFDGDGFVRTPIGAGDDVANAVAVQPDGKILVAGHANNGTDLDFALVRYNPDGSLDQTFFFDGKVRTAIGPGDEAANAIVVLPDGRIIAAGWSVLAGRSNVAVIRYKPDGSLDTSFGPAATGKVTILVGTGDAAANGAARQTDGRIVLAGTAANGATDDVAVVRLNFNGTLDPSFDADGQVATPIGAAGDAGIGVAIQSDERIVVAGSSFNGATQDVALLRYNSDGSLDASLDGDGRVTTDLSIEDQGNALAIQPDGAILVAATTAGVGVSDFALLRYTAVGALDPTYGTAGVVQVGFLEGGPDEAAALALDSAGRAVAAGSAAGLFGVVRLLGDDVIVAVGEGPVLRTPLRLGTPWPNPTRNRASLDFELAAQARVDVIVLDVAGRLIRRVSAGKQFSAGRHTLTWDGRNESGARVPSGVYLLRAATGGMSQVRRVAVVR